MVLINDKSYSYHGTISRITISKTRKVIFSASILQIGKQWTIGHYNIFMPDYSNCDSYTTLMGICTAMSKHPELSMYIN